jgi:hypothetical protein
VGRSGKSNSKLIQVPQHTPELKKLCWRTLFQLLPLSRGDERLVLPRNAKPASRSPSLPHSLTKPGVIQSSRKCQLLKTHDSRLTSNTTRPQRLHNQVVFLNELFLTFADECGYCRTATLQPFFPGPNICHKLHWLTYLLAIDYTCYPQ